MPVDVGLDSILSPLKTADFVGNAWRKKTLHIPGDENKFRDIFSLDSLRGLLKNHREHSPAAVRLRAGYKDAAGEHRDMEALPAQFDALLAAGMTLFLLNLGEVDPAMTRLLRRLRTELAITSPMFLSCFVSMDQSGYGLHFDPVDVLVLQIEGVKHWAVGDRAAVDCPPHAVIPTRQQQASGLLGFKEEALREVTLRPGDVLYLPAGTWHRPRAEGYSLHLSIGFCHDVTPLGLLTAVLKPLVEQEPAWRLSPSLGGPMSSPEEIRAFMAGEMLKRAAELRDFLGQITAEQIIEAWHRFTDQPASSTAPPSALAPPAREDLLSLVNREAFSFTVDPSRDADDSLIIFDAGQAVVTFPSRVRPWVQRLAQHPQFTASEALQWEPSLSWKSVQLLLQSLMNTGVLRAERSTETARVHPPGHAGAEPKAT